ncbi:TetR/AcrR family transcriptional regulator [Streptomyces sp. NPDC085937]|uniref:TetR/AcrR family transcriptional regulator n=1 Tax=Streptomyces sp. NPDC085937 TaxID=3365742 RepID=UPI0037D95386
MVVEAAPRRRRMTPEREAELYAVVRGLIREVGYEALTMDAVAARTRTSKVTLYRLWDGKTQLVVKALRSRKPRFDALDTGSLRGDLHAMVRRDDDHQMEQNNALIRGLMTAVHTHPELLTALRDRVIEPELADLNRMLQRAVDRGEIRPDSPALPYVIHMLTGAFTTRKLIDGQPPTQAYLTSYIDAVVLPTLAAGP